MDYDKALKLLALPREVARHPEQDHGLASHRPLRPLRAARQTYATLSRDDDVLEVGNGNRAIDLIVAKESGAAGASRRSDPGRPLGRPGERAKHRRQSRPLRPLCHRRLRQRHPAARDGAGCCDLDETVGLLNVRRASGRGKSKRRAPGRAAKGGKGSAAGAKKAASTKKAAAAKQSAARKPRRAKTLPNRLPFSRSRPSRGAAAPFGRDRPPVATNPRRSKASPRQAQPG